MVRGIVSKFFLLIFFSNVAISSELDFKLDGNLVATHSKDSLLKAGQKSEELKVFNVLRKYSKNYIGFKLFDLLDFVYGSAWKDKKTITYKALDNYQQTAKIEELLKAAKNKIGLLAYKEADREGFTKHKKGNKEIDPGPFYLVWTGYEESDRPKQTDPLKWPYQLKEISVR